ncbi:type II secretion system protein N [Colwellia sp. E2M01]|uniref:type II secretion system protein N n=1 Tax=Colwellia sp. E2M01 TaxID=2841561 RepID=UPI001C08746C|nr:type II secretion system protein N [Colwellia sp. E2M01]MBU2870317.1 type II secretion system protein N [Colwellia sp. E2M01]
MKKWFAFTAIFFGSYFVFLVATIPLAVLLNNINLPKNVSVGIASGTIWQGEINKVFVNNNEIEKINTELSFWSLLFFAPSIDVSFGDAMLNGPEGKLTLTVSSSELSLNDVELFLNANDIAQNLPLPIPASAQGNVEIALTELTLNTSNKLTCEYAQGQVSWIRASVNALNYDIKVGSLKADISCEDGDLLAKILPDNDLGVTLDTRLNLATQKATGQGFVKPGPKFPANLKQALTFLGRPDAQGQYRLRF